MKLSTQQLIELQSDLSLFLLLKESSPETRNALLDALDMTRTRQLEAEIKAHLDNIAQRPPIVTNRLDLLDIARQNT